MIPETTGLTLEQSKLANYVQFHFKKVFITVDNAFAAKGSVLVDSEKLTHHEMEADQKKQGGAFVSVLPADDRKTY